MRLSSKLPCLRQPIPDITSGPLLLRQSFLDDRLWLTPTPKQRAVIRLLRSVTLFAVGGRFLLFAGAGYTSGLSVLTLKPIIEPVTVLVEAYHPLFAPSDLTTSQTQVPLVIISDFA